MAEVKRKDQVPTFKEEEKLYRTADEWLADQKKDIGKNVTQPFYF